MIEIFMATYERSRKKSLGLNRRSDVHHTTCLVQPMADSLWSDSVELVYAKRMTAWISSPPESRAPLSGNLPRLLNLQKSNERDGCWKMNLEKIQLDPSFARAVEWMLKEELVERFSRAVICDNPKGTEWIMKRDESEHVQGARVAADSSALAFRRPLWPPHSCVNILL